MLSIALSSNIIDLLNNTYIPLNPVMSDKAICMHTPNGEFTIKSAFKLLINQKDVGMASITVSPRYGNCNAQIKSSSLFG